MVDCKGGIDDETRRVLAKLASRAGTRISGLRRARWEPGNVNNPQDRYLGGVFTEETAWGLIAEKLRDGHARSRRRHWTTRRAPPATC